MDWQDGGWALGRNAGYGGRTDQDEGGLVAEWNEAFVTRSFPALGRGQVFLDNAGGSQVAQQVGERITQYLFSANVQLGASYAASVKAADMVHQARNAHATMLNAERAEEVVMGATTTQLFDQLARALVQTWAPGDEVIVTNFAHAANIGQGRHRPPRMVNAARCSSSGP